MEKFKEKSITKYNFQRRPPKKMQIQLNFLKSGREEEQNEKGKKKTTITNDNE